MSGNILYTNDTKLKDLTVGQLKDIIIETLSHGLLNRDLLDGRPRNYQAAYLKPSVDENTIRM